jgi:restriction system protein
MQSNLGNAFLTGVFLKLWYVWLILGLVLIGRLIFYLLEKQRLAMSGIADIDSMDGKTFEKYLQVLFERLGYRVERTRYIGDYGADLVTSKDGIKTVIQAKRHKSQVGIKAIQEAVAAKGYYDCQAAMVVTNSYYTNQAKTLASKNGVELWDRKDLVRALLKIRDDGVVKPIHTLQEDTKNEDSSTRCATCGAPVSEKVRQYCLAHRQKFQGKIYCFEHQRGRADAQRDNDWERQKTSI